MKTRSVTLFLVVLVLAFVTPSTAFAADEKTVAACSDGKDNDGNGSVDCDDTECTAACALIEAARVKREEAAALAAVPRVDALKKAADAKFSRVSKSILRVNADYESVTPDTTDWDKMATTTYEMAKVRFKGNDALLGQLEDNKEGRGAVEALTSEKFVMKWLPRLGGSVGVAKAKKAAKPVNKVTGVEDLQPGEIVGGPVVANDDIDCFAVRAKAFTGCKEPLNESVHGYAQCQSMIANYIVGRCGK